MNDNDKTDEPVAEVVDIDTNAKQRKTLKRWMIVVGAAVGGSLALGAALAARKNTDDESE